jgi:hypothetical protein
VTGQPKLVERPAGVGGKRLGLVERRQRGRGEGTAGTGGIR